MDRISSLYRHIGTFVKETHKRSLYSMFTPDFFHIIVRKKDDATFPKPVWGNAAAKLYSAEAKAIIIDKIRQNLKTKQHG